VAGKEDLSFPLDGHLYTRQNFHLYTSHDMTTNFSENKLTPF